MRVLVYTSLYPNETNPVHGIFVEELVKGLTRLAEVRVVAPENGFRWLSAWLSHRSGRRSGRGEDAYRCRFWTVPKLLKSLDGRFMAGWSRKSFRRAMAVLLGLMAWYGLYLTAQAAWLPVLLLYLVLTSLAVNLVGAALNVFYRDVSQFLPVAISLVMYASPIIYPLSLVKRVLLVSQAAGPNSHLLYFLYTLNPLVGIVDAFQNVLLHNQPPDMSVIWPGAMVVVMILPISYEYFKRTEHSFADVI